jgi:hypothetical protein
MSDSCSFVPHVRRTRKSPKEGSVSARFWVQGNGGPVKLTLRPGDVVWWFTGHGDDQLHHGEWHAWAFNGRSVDWMIDTKILNLMAKTRLVEYRTTRWCRLSRLRDCDGCLLDADVRFPKWESIPALTTAMEDIT